MEHRRYKSIKAFALGTTAAALLALSIPGAHAEHFSFTVVAGHPPITKGVAGIRDFFIPEVTKRVAERTDHTVEWTEAYAGSVADVRGVLEAVESGIAEFGYVPHLFEGDKLPLEQITYVTPFGTDDLQTLMQVIDKLHAEVPEMGEGWEKANQKLLAPVGIDTYHFQTTFPIESLSDLQDRKIGAGGLALNWLKGSGAVPVSGALTTYYNAMSTGLYDGVMTFESAIAPYKFYEVAPYITKINFGAKYSSALTVNLDTWNSLPEEVRNIMTEVAQEYRDRTAKAYFDAGEKSLKVAADNGATIFELSAEQRAEYAGKLPDLATEWAQQLDAQGLPGTKTLETYLRLANEAGLEFARDWSAQ